jgi:aminoglycoside phosphotransferase (APT) family kinase protein
MSACRRRHSMLAQTWNAIIRPRLMSQPWLNRSGYRRARNAAAQCLLALQRAGAGATDGAWQLDQPLLSETDMTIVPARHSDGRSVFIKMPQSQASLRNMRAQDAALRALAQTERLSGWQIERPQVLLAGALADGTAFSIESGMHGQPAQTLWPSAQARPRVLAAALAAIGPLHSLTSRTAPVDEASLARWIDQPVAHISHVIGASGPAAARNASLQLLREQLHQALAGGVLTTSWIHGDYWPGNIFMGGAQSGVSGMIDWDRAQPGELPLHDVISMLVAARMSDRRQEMGQVVANLLREPRWTPLERACLDAMPGWDGLLADHVALFLYWLRQISFTLLQSDRFAQHRIWMRGNVLTVIDCVRESAMIR